MHFARLTTGISIKSTFKKVFLFKAIFVFIFLTLDVWFIEKAQFKP